jgi:hypothetical protein
MIILKEKPCSEISRTGITEGVKNGIWNNAAWKELENLRFSLAVLLTSKNIRSSIKDAVVKSGSGSNVLIAGTGGSISFPFSMVKSYSTAIDIGENRSGYELNLHNGDAIYLQV